MTPLLPNGCPSCGSTENPFKLTLRETEQDLFGEFYHVTSPALECRHCGTISLGPGHAEALRQSVHDAYRERHGLNKSHPTHREMNLTKAELSDLENARNRLIPWLSDNTPQAHKNKKEHQDRLFAVLAREQKLSQEFEELANLRGEEFERLTLKIKQLDSKIITCTVKLQDAQALLETKDNDRNQSELKVTAAAEQTKITNAKLKSLVGTIATLERKIERLKPGSTLFERQIEGLKSRLATEKERQKTTESDLEDATIEINALNRNISDHKREFQNLKNRYAREQRLLEEERSLAEELRQNLKKATEINYRHGNSEAALKRAEKNLGKKDSELKKAIEKIRSLGSHSNLESVFHLSNERVIRWLSSEIEYPGWEIPEQATMLGEDPISWNQMFMHLGEWHCIPYLYGTEWIILGRDGWTPKELDELIAKRGGEDIKIVSQELFLAAVISGHDPFMADEEVLLAFAEGHPALEYLRDAAFEWPFGCLGPIETPPPPEPYGVEISPLKAMDPPYTVGERGYRESTRRKILTKAYNGELPWVESDEYMELWGRPGTRQRLRQMAYHISRQIPKHRGMWNHDTAVREWEEDLEWLFHEFYKPWMRFGWPDI